MLKVRAAQLAQNYKRSPVITTLVPITDLGGYAFSEEQKKAYNSSEGTPDEKLVRQWRVYLKVSRRRDRLDLCFTSVVLVVVGVRARSY